MRRTIKAAGGTVAALALTASTALAGGGVSDVAMGHGDAVKEVAQAADYVSGQARGEAVSALAKQHGAEVSAAAKAMAETKAEAGKSKGAEKAAQGKANAGGPTN